MKKFTYYLCLCGLFVLTLSSCKTSQVAAPAKTVPAQAADTFDEALLKVKEFIKPISDYLDDESVQ